MLLIEGTVRDKARPPIGELHLGNLGGDDWAEVVCVTPIAPEGRHQHGETGLVCDDQVQHPLREVRALIPTGAAGDVPHVLRRLRGTVITALAMEAGAVEMGKRGDKPPRAWRP